MISLIPKITKKKITKMNKGEIIFGKEKDGFRT